MRKLEMAPALTLALALVVAVFVAAAPVEVRADLHLPPYRCADFDHSGTVSIEEVGEVIDHFGTFPGSPPNEQGTRWSGRYNLDPGGFPRVDLTDILIAVQQWGAGEGAC